MIPSLISRIKPGGVYLGVGPDQNFTYIVALKPKMAFVIDIRRQNLLEHLIYKMLIEASVDRADFLSRLFSRKRPAGLGVASSPLQLLEASFNALPDKALYQANLTGILTMLRKRGFTLGPDDEAGIAYVYGMFFTAGPAITYSSGQAGRSGRGIGGGRGRGRGMPNYTDLMLANDGQGVLRSYLATEDRFAAIRTMERDNLVVPVVGDFAGGKAIRVVGQYVRDHRATVTTFYLSNVEQYLFQNSRNWKAFYANVATLPLDGTSSFIRSCFQGCGGSQFWQPYASRGGPMRSAQLTQSIPDLLDAVKRGKITSYTDVIARSK